LIRFAGRLRSELTYRQFDDATTLAADTATAEAAISRRADYGSLGFLIHVRTVKGETRRDSIEAFLTSRHE
jgi:uncharacterized protein YkwD